MAIETEDLVDSYRALRESAGVVDQPAVVIEVSGPDAVDFLQGQITNDVAAVEPGAGCYALLLNPKGRILAELRVFVQEPERIWISSEQGETVLSNLTTYKIGRQVEVRGLEMAIESVIGPGTGEVVGVDVPEREHSFVQAELNGARVLVVRTDRGVDLIHDGADHARVEDHLAQRGAGPVTPEAAEVIRIESGRPRYGVDMTADNLPGELGLEERAVSFTKGCYVGQEPVARMHHRGHPNRHLRGLDLQKPAAAGTPLQRDGKDVGIVTSACVSPALGAIALALVRREVEPGHAVELNGGRATGTVVELPFERDG